MSTASKIEWTEATWNPTTGCDRISPGCAHCYALTLARRLKAMGQPKYQNDGDPRTSGQGFAVTVHQDALWEPLRWRKPRVVFVNSMSDLFHARVPDSFIASVFGVMAMTPQHTYQVLTKRPRRMRTLLSTPAFWFRVNDAADAATDALTAINPRWPGVPSMDPVPWPLPNVWAGTSIENDDYTWRADDLRQVPAAVRFLSLEPLLGPLPSLNLESIGWVIAGGESGPGHRVLDLAWVRGIRDRCASQDVAFFFKQVGGPTPKAGGRQLDGRTWDQTPPLPVSRKSQERHAQEAEERTMTERYIAPEVSESLGRLRTALPAAAARQDGTRLDRAGLIDEIEGSFAHLMSTGPDYSRAVAEYVQDAVRCFSRGSGDQAQAALRRAHDAVPGKAARPAAETGVNDA